MRKTAVLFISVLIAVLCLTACSSAPIVGKWTDISGTEGQELTFNEDGSMIFMGTVGCSYSLNGDILTMINTADKKLEYRINFVNSNKIELLKSDGSTAVVLIRKT